MSLRNRLVGAAINAYLTWAQRPTRARSLDFYFQPDDPYSYLLAQLVPALRERYRVPVTTRVVLSPEPAANTEVELRLRHAARDCRELSRYYELDFPGDVTLPNDDDVLRAASAVLGGADAAEVGAALWRGDAASLAPPSPDTRARARANVERLHARGHYMGGMLHLGHQWFWGVDRLHYVERALGGEPKLLKQRPADQWPAGEAATELDYFYSFRSPYSYLSIDRTLALPVKVNIRPVLPMVMRGHRVPRAKRLYIAKDCKREADRLGIPFGRICDPLGPGIERCCAVFERADADGKGGELLRSIGRGTWAESLDVASDADLRVMVERAGVRWSDAVDAMRDDGWRDRVEHNRQALYAEGMWGVPSYRLGDYRTWGQDRIWILEAKLARNRG